MFSPLQAELLDVLFGLETAIGQGYKKVIIETDFLLVVNEIERGGYSLCEWGNIVCNICFYLEQCEEGVVGHVKREANSLAHNLTKMSIPEDYDKFSWKEIPSSCCNTVAY